jgi:hypothetical protein
VHALALGGLLLACSARNEALQRGLEAARPCVERFHDQGHTYAECVRYVAAHSAADADPWRLGALTEGWMTADLAARQTGDVDAPRAAGELLAEADTVQRRLGVTDAALCRLLGPRCAAWRDRRTALHEARA